MKDGGRIVTRWAPAYQFGIAPLVVIPAFHFATTRQRKSSISTWTVPPALGLEQRYGGTFPSYAGVLAATVNSDFRIRMIRSLVRSQSAPAETSSGLRCGRPTQLSSSTLSRSTPLKPRESLSRRPSRALATIGSAVFKESKFCKTRSSRGAASSGGKVLFENCWRLRPIDRSGPSPRISWEPLTYG